MRAASNLLIWVPVAILGIFASFGALVLSSAMDLRNLPYWAALALNLFPAFLCGFGCYYFMGRREQCRENPSRQSTRHLRRAWPLYVISALLVGYIWSERADKSFGLWAQLVVWPLAATFGGIAGDALVGRARPRRTAPA